MIALSLLCLAAVAEAQPNDYDFDFVTITHPGNPAYTANPDRLRTHERGSVGYEYRIARTEISTAQYVEFINAIGFRDPQSFLTMTPSAWGAARGPDGPNGEFQYRLNPNLADAGNVPVAGISFEEAAVYCNWLHNGKRGVDDASLTTGAYDIDIFLGGSVGNVTLPRNPDAKYWIPTLDEWIKATYWDPNKPDRDGWWENPHTSDDTPQAGTNTNRGLADSIFDVIDFRIGEYPDAQTPWGLLDTSGGVTELLASDDPFSPSDEALYAKGSSLAGANPTDHITGLRIVPASTGFSFSGIRIASAIPAPFTVAPIAFASCLFGRRPRR